MKNKPDAYGIFSTDLHVMKTWAVEKELLTIIKKIEELQTLLDDYENTNREDKK